MIEWIIVSGVILTSTAIGCFIGNRLFFGPRSHAQEVRQRLIREMIQRERETSDTT